MLDAKGIMGCIPHRYPFLLLDRVLEMDYAPVVSLFAEANALTPEEIEELSRLLEEEGAS